MSGELGSGDTALYRELLAVGVAENRAIQLQNLMMHCGYATFGVNRADAELCIATRDLTAAETLALVRAAAQKGSTVALMSPCKGRARQSLCRRIAAEHPSTTVDNRGYLLIFNNHLPKQHFRI